MRVHVAHPQPSTRLGIYTLLGRSQDFEPGREANAAADLLAGLDAPGIAILDPSCEKNNLPNLVEAACLANPELRPHWTEP